MYTYLFNYLLLAGEGDNYPSLPVIVTGETEPETIPEPTAEAEPTEMPVADVIKSLVHFLANRPTHMPLWQYEDITAKGKCILIRFFLPWSKFVGELLQLQTVRIIFFVLLCLFEILHLDG